MIHELVAAADAGELDAIVRLIRERRRELSRQASDRYVAEQMARPVMFQLVAGDRVFVQVGASLKDLSEGAGILWSAPIPVMVTRFQVQLGSPQHLYRITHPNDRGVGVERPEGK